MRSLSLRICEQGSAESLYLFRQIIQLEDTGISKGQMAQLASGFANASSSFGRGMVVRHILVNLADI